MYAHACTSTGIDCKTHTHMANIFVLSSRSSVTRNVLQNPAGYFLRACLQQRHWFRHGQSVGNVVSPLTEMKILKVWKTLMFTGKKMIALYSLEIPSYIYWTTQTWAGANHNSQPFAWGTLCCAYQYESVLPMILGRSLTEGQHNNCKYMISMLTKPI